MNTYMPLAHIPKGFAVICSDCEHVFDVRAHTCVNCASESFMPIATWLDREVPA